jgi:thioredoxin 1
MKSWHCCVLGVIGLVLGLALAWPPAEALAGPAPAPGKPALYDFGRSMCIPCKEMEKILGSIKGKYGNQVEVRLVMAEKNEDLFKQYKIMLIPTQVFLDASGKEVFRHVGLYPEKELVIKLKELNFIK